MELDEQTLLATNERFYRAFAGGDLAAMEDLWAHQTPVVCIHPGWSRLSSRETVMTSWRRILSGEGHDVSCGDAQAWVRGTMGMVVCREQVGRIDLLATNVFVVEGGRWMLIHHHAAPVMPDEEPGPEESSSGHGLPN